MAIFHDKAMVASDTTLAQRVLHEIAATKRAQTEEIHTGSQRVEIEDDGSRDTRAEYREEPNLTNFEPITSFTPISSSSPTPFITQDNHNSPPSANTRNRRQGMITQDHMLNMMEVATQCSPFA
jgi:hypothetical protein